MLFFRFGAFALLSTLTVSCGSATFSSSPTASRQQNKTHNLACTVSPQVTYQGQATSINVTSADWLKAPIHQKIIKDTEVKSSTIQRSREKFLLGDGSNNTFTTDTVGHYKVELRINELNTEADAFCEFTVEKVKDVNISCDVDGAEFMEGSTHPINVSVEGRFSGEITQKISGAVSLESNLKKKDDSWRSLDGSANEVYFSKAGQYNVSYEVKDSNGLSVGVKECNITVKPKTTTCENGEKTIGAHVAILVDNSSSNAVTDCPNPVRTGTSNGVNTYECKSTTNREKAVLSAYDSLVAVYNEGDRSEDSKSSMAVASFPTRSDFAGGWKVETNAWLSTTPNMRNDLASSMLFARKPFGLTPYRAAMNAANDLFTEVANSEKAKVAILVTDGEPTDQDPIAVREQAEDLRAQGVKVITVFVTGSQTRAQRKAQHVEMLREFNESYLSGDPATTWYEESIGTFERYIELINGSNGEADLVEKVSSKKDGNCIDQNGQICDRMIIEVANASSLKTVFKDIIRTQAIQCR